MPLIPQDLDTRRFEDIFAEAKQLIPRYAPEWTDHNESDPGITMLQLFSWMTEMMLFRLNQVPERNYIKFLQLIGIELTPSRSAEAEIAFTTARDDIEYVLVPRYAQVATSGGEPVVFETSEELFVLGAKLKSVQSFDGFAYRVETSRNENAQPFNVFGSKARDNSALLLGFDSPVAFTTKTVNLAFYAAVDPRREPMRDCGLDLGSTPPPGKVVWEYYDGKNWQPLSVIRDDTRAFARSGHVYLRGPGAAVVKSMVGESSTSLYWLRARLVKGGYDEPPRIRAVRINTAAALQAQTQCDEVVGGSDGRPSQVVRVANVPVLNLTLEIDEGSGFRQWTEVEDFFASGPDDAHFTLNKTTGELRFGDGRHGRIPVANPANAFANIVAREYRFGGGRRGNVGAGVISALQTFVEGIGEAKNEWPATGGADEETLEEAKLRAPREIKSRNRAVTSEDFEFLAMETAGVRIARAKALPLFHPKFEETDIPGVVTVIVVPQADGPAPMPGDATLRAVCVQLNRHRLLTSEVYVIGPRYAKVKVTVDVVVQPDADLAEVKQDVEERLANYFHPLHGGENGTGWPFGGTIFFSGLSRLILSTPGVDRIDNNNLLLLLDNEPQIFCRDVRLRPGDLLQSEQHDVRVSYAGSEA